MIEEDLHNHICKFLVTQHGYLALSANDITDKEYYFIEKHLKEFIYNTQFDTWDHLQNTYYGSDTLNQIIRVIKEDLQIKPLWLVIKEGIKVKEKTIYLYTPRPRSQNSSDQLHAYKSNIFSFKKEFYFTNDNNEAIDLVLFLNGLPIITTELKHHGKTGSASTYNDAITQYVDRRQNTSKIFTLPFAHFAADTDEAYVSTNSSDENYFQPFNTGLNNAENTEKPEDEYPIWHLYAQAFSPEYICDFIEYFLVYVPVNIEKQKSAFTIIPRFHQLRSTRNLTTDLLEFSEQNDKLGKRYLINHSPGSGKTFTISWMSERLDSLHKSTNNQKVLDHIFILTDRKSLDTNVKDDLQKFSHLINKMVFTDSASELIKAIKDKKNIIVTTIQKFNYVQEKLKEDPTLKTLKVAFLIDEAHRSQSGKMGTNVRTTFAQAAEPKIIYSTLGAEEEEENEESTIEDSVEETILKIDISNQVYIAFTATPTPKTLTIFGKPFDTYSEEEAIKEGYILDVADNIVSYKTLYHLNTTWVKPDDKLYPEGLVNKLLRDIAFEDESIIQYKSTVIIENFEAEIKNMLDGKAKAMVVTSSRQAGYNYYLALKEIIRKKELDFKILYAFTPFTEKISKKPLTEAEVNGITISDETPIESYFEKDEYKLLVVANKFQQGFDEPLLCAMYLDKIVKGVNAVQTVSRLNRKYPNKEKTLVIDFTNNAKEIFKAFAKYRNGAKVREIEPNPEELQELYDEIWEHGVFTEDMVKQYVETAKEGNDAVFASMTAIFRSSFELSISDKDDRKIFVNLLLKYIKKYNFFSQFFQFENYLEEFALFADLIAGKLIKLGSESSLKKSLQNVTVEKASVKFLGNSKNNTKPREPKEGKPNSDFVPPKATIQDVIDDIRRIYKIEEGDEIIIKGIYADTMNDKDLMNLIFANKDNNDFLQNNVAQQLRGMIIDAYKKQGHLRKTKEPLYKDNGGIFDLLVSNIIRHAIYKGGVN